MKPQLRSFLPNLTVLLTLITSCHSGPQEQPHESAGETATSERAVATLAPPTAPAATSPASPDTTFTYQPPAPVNGRLAGVIELGASGLNAFVVRVDEQMHWKLEDAQYGQSGMLAGDATVPGIRRKLERYLKQMQAAGVRRADVHFVLSSGADKTVQAASVGNALRGLGYRLTTVTPIQEGAFAMDAVLPPTFVGRAFVVDIGSSNTKISWREDAEVDVSTETVGSQYQLTGVADSTARRVVAVKARQVPSAQRGTCFLIGGVPFELARQTRRGHERYTVLRTPDFYLPTTPKQHAGLVIYQAIAESTGCRQFVFDWDANFVIGYVLGQP